MSGAERLSEPPSPADYIARAEQDAPRFGLSLTPGAPNFATPGYVAILAAIEDRRVECEWFLGCHNLATHLEPHPVLEPVPACDRCPKIGR